MVIDPVAGLVVEERTMNRVALYAVNLMRDPPEHAAMRGLFDHLEVILASARNTEGCIWVEYACDHAPRFSRIETSGYPLATLSMWQDLESAVAFTFHFNGPHGTIMRRRNEWLVPFTGPMYTVWWVTESRDPGWAEAVERIDHLRAHGPTPHAFTFAMSFDEHGQPLRLNQARINARRNSVR
jgi:quinol monooxygenase YgiN